MTKDETYHPNAHISDVRNFRAQELAVVTLPVTYEERREGEGEKRVCRTTSVPPLVCV